MPNLSKTSTEFFILITFISSCVFFFLISKICLVLLCCHLLLPNLLNLCYLSKCGKHGYFTFRLIIPVSEIFGSFFVVPLCPISMCFVIFYLELPILLAHLSLSVGSLCRLIWSSSREDKSLPLWVDWGRNNIESLNFSFDVFHIIQVL